MTREQSGSLVRHGFTLLRVAAAVGLLAWLIESGAIEWSSLARLASAWPFALAALGLLGAQVVVTSWRLCVLLRPNALHLPLAASIRLTLIGLFFMACLPGAAGGDVVRIYFATGGRKGQGAELAAMLMLDRLVGMFALVCWPLAAALLFSSRVADSAVLSGVLWGAAVMGLAMAVIVALTFGKRFRSNVVLVRVLEAVPMGAIGSRMLNTLHGYRRHPKVLAFALAISFLAHGLIMGATLLLAYGLDPGGFDWIMALVVPVGFLANTLPLTPGGIGVGEAAMDRLFALVGLGGGAEALLGWRMLTLVISLLGLVYYTQGRKQFVQDAPRSHQAEDARRLAPVPAAPER